MPMTREEREALDRSMRHGATETGGGRRTIDPRAPGGDPERLRNIPAIGRSVQGHVPGTQPEQAVMKMRGRA